MVDFDVKIIRGDACDPAASVLTTRSFDDKDHVFVCSMADDAEEIGEFGFKKTAIESELPAGKGLGCGKGRFDIRGRGGLRSCFRHR